MASSLKAEAKNSVQSNVKAIYGQLDMAIAKIRTSSKISKASIESMHRELIQEINKAVKDVKGKLEKQKAAEEQERLRKIQEVRNFRIFYSEFIYCSDVIATDPKTISEVLEIFDDKLILMFFVHFQEFSRGLISRRK